MIKKCFKSEENDAIGYIGRNRRNKKVFDREKPEGEWYWERISQVYWEFKNLREKSPRKRNKTQRETNNTIISKINNIKCLWNFQAKNSFSIVYLVFTLWKKMLWTCAHK